MVTVQGTKRPLQGWRKNRPGGNGGQLARALGHRKGKRTPAKGVGGLNQELGVRYGSDNLAQHSLFRH